MQAAAQASAFVNEVQDKRFRDRFSAPDKGVRLKLRRMKSKTFRAHRTNRAGASGASRLAQHFCRPLVQAGAAAFGCNQRGAVYFGRHAQHELATGLFFNNLAELGAANPLRRQGQRRNAGAAEFRRSAGVAHGCHYAACRCCVMCLYSAALLRSSCHRSSACCIRNQIAAPLPT